MSNNQFEWAGLAELRAALRALPSELTGEASHIVGGSADDAATEVKAHYARGKTGNLINGVVVEHIDPGPFAAGAVVKSKAKQAWMYENGTQVRHTQTGANRGVMPPAKPGRAFIPTIIRKRKQMYERLAELLKRHGLQVTGSA